MISFTALTPHPPLLIPEIGKDNFDKVSKTAEAMNDLSKRFEKADIDTVIIISPHGSLNPYAMTVGQANRFSGNFSDFNCPEIKFSFKGNIELAESILAKASDEKIDTTIQNHESSIYQLDHGVMVPLSYLTKETGPNMKIVTIGYSMLSRADHFSFGQLIGQISRDSSERIAIVASGDLSHRHINNQTGILDSPQKFDNLICDNLSEFDAEKILYVDDDLQESAGECGYRSLLILLGAIDGLKIKSEVLSYEHPFGVGYLVADFRIEE